MMVSCVRLSGSPCASSSLAVVSLILYVLTLLLTSLLLPQHLFFAAIAGPLAVVVLKGRVEGLRSRSVVDNFEFANRLSLRGG